jgi:hypothetical protein
MNRIHPECPDSDPSDRSVAAEGFLRHKPAKEVEEEEDDDEGGGKEDHDEDDKDDDGY